MNIKRIATGFILVFVLFLVACATTQSGLLRSSSSYDTVFEASVDAINDVGYTITSSDYRSGVIVASKFTFSLTVDFEDKSKLNVLVRKIGKGEEVKVTVNLIAPSLIVSNIGKGGNKDLTEYIVALKKRVPDIIIVQQ